MCVCVTITSLYYFNPAVIAPTFLFVDAAKQIRRKYICTIIKKGGPYYRTSSGP